MDNHRDDRDFFAALEVHTPSLLPGIRGAVSFHRSWNKPRITRFKEAILRASHLSEGDLHEVIQEADSKADLLTVTASRVNDRGDRQYSDLLARLVAAALVDDSKIDATAYIVDRIVQLEPVHLRILAAVRTSDLVGQGIKELPEAARRAEREKWDSTDPIVVYSDIHIERLGAAVQLPAGVVEACLGDMVGVGFVVSKGGEYDPPKSPVGSGNYMPVKWHLSDLGRAAADEIEAVRRDLVME